MVEGNIEMRLVLWGAGSIGKRFLKHLNDEDIIAYIDSDREKIGTKIKGVQVVSFEEYLEKYRDAYIVITHHVYHEALRKLKENNIRKVFFCTDCPGEWADECEREEFKVLIEKKIKGNVNGVVYGCNIYGLFLAKLIAKTIGKNPIIAYSASTDIGLIAELKKDFPQQIIIPFNEVEQCDRVYVAEDRRKGFDKENKLLTTEVIECWDCSFEITEYHNTRIKSCYNSNNGESCFIIGNGPSLRIADLDTLKEKNIDCFGVNEIYHAFNETKWRPKYYVVGDTYTLEQLEDVIDCSSFEKVFFSDQLGDEYNSRMSALIGEKYFRFHIQRTNNMNLLPRFSEDLSIVAYYGATVTYLCLQFAVYMGYKHIFLLGVDATGSSRYKNIGYETYSHFFNEKKKVSIFTEPYMTHAYMAAEEYAKKHSINIYNATRGGELEVFRRVDFDSIFMD